jgi:hypothetical protein
MSKRVYWAPIGDLTRNTRTELLNVTPEPLMSDLMEKKAVPYWPEVAYQACPSAKKFFKNMYSIKSPVTRGITLNEAGQINSSKDSNWFVPRPSYFYNAPAFDFDLVWIFFSEDDLVIEQHPPYMHQTTASKSANLAAGSFNISKWFRPIVASYSMWPGVREFSITEGDPLFYVKFNTEEKIEFVKFQTNEKIQEIARGATDFKQVLPFQPLDSLYKRFVESGRRKVLLNELKKAAL